MERNISIIGAGSSGLRLARKLAENELPVTVFEDHPEIGVPEHCSGLLSARNSIELGFDLKESLANTIYGAKIYSPNNTQLRIESKKPAAYVVDRSLFDKTLYQQAKKAGADIQLNTSVMNIRGSTIFTQSNGRGGAKKADIMVAADGVNSRLRKLVGVESKPTDFVHSYQVKASGNFDPRFVELYFGESFAPDFFAWVIPENESSAKIGLGCRMGTNPVHAFKKFLKEKQIDIHIKSDNSFLIPCAPPIKKLVSENMLLLGDAAYMVKSTTGGGIIMNCKSADILASVIHDHIHHQIPLSEYEKRMEPIFSELELHWKIHLYQTRQKDEQLDKLFLKLKDAGMEHFLSREGDMDEPSRFIGKMIAHPGILSLIPEAVKFALTK